MQEFSRGFVAPFKAFGFIFKHRLAAWYLVPIGIWIVLIFGTTFSLASWLSPYVEQWLSDALGSAKLPEESFWTAAKSWLQTGIQFASAWVLRVLIWIALGRVMKYVILILMSPLLAWISEVTEEKLTGKEYPFDLMQLLSDAWRGVLITLRNLNCCSPRRRA
jgi:CysZ protein